MIVNVRRSKEAHKKFGKIVRINFPDKSKIYISKKGWILATPKRYGKQLQKMINKIKENGRMEVLLPFGEIQIAIDETIRAGYVSNRVTQDKIRR